MAYRDDYYPPRGNNVAGLFAGAVFLFGLAAALWFGLPILKQYYATTAPAPTARPAPTFSAIQRGAAAVAAPASAAEQQVLSSGPAVEGTPLPVFTPVPNVPRQPSNAQPADDVPGASFSPQDLGSRPAPTPTTMLSPEEYEASQASEEVNQLDTMQSGLTEAQKAVQEHDAQWNARTP